VVAWGAYFDNRNLVFDQSSLGEDESFTSSEKKRSCANAYSAYYIGPVVTRGTADLAIQCRLGILPSGRPGHHSGSCSYLGLARSDVRQGGRAAPSEFNQFGLIYGSRGVIRMRWGGERYFLGPTRVSPI
jgi:hypothetical protein